MTDKKYSEQLKEVLTFFNKCKTEYADAVAMLSVNDNLTQDYLHELELGNKNYKERAKIATSLSKCRKERRKYKDKIQELQFINKFITDNKQVIHTLENVLGQTRKEENAHVNRIYIPRVKE